MKKLRGFSLAEMMVVLLIISIVAAAAAPMVNKRALSIAAERTPWVWTNQNNIAYNLSGRNDQTATVGAMSPPNNESPRLYVDSTNNTPHMVFGSARANLTRLFANSNHILFTNAQIANPQNITNAVVIGPGTSASNNSIALGVGTQVQGSGIAIGTPDGSGNGTSLGANAQNSLAIGRGARVTSGQGSIAIGGGANVDDANSIAIGNGASIVQAQNSIAIGRSSVTANRAVAISPGQAAPIVGNSIAIGNANAGEDSVVIGNYNTNQTSSNIVAIGNNLNANTSMGQNSVSIGNSASAAQTGVAIGFGAEARTSGVSLGVNANSNGAITSRANAVAIGIGTEAAASSVAIGNTAQATGANSIAIGPFVNVTGAGSVAIGNNINLATDNTIQLGTAADTVYIPGNLVVGGHIAGLGLFAEKYLIVSGRNKAFFRRELSGTLNNEVFRNAELKGDYTGQPVTLPENTVKEHTYYQGPTLYRTYVNSYTDEIGNSVTSFSDRRLKNVGESFKAGLEEVKKLEVFHYTFKKDPAKTARVGVMAQDLQKIFPDAVFKGEDGFLRIRMEDMFYAVVNAIKELDLKLIANDKKIEDLEKQNSELEKLIEEMETQVKQLNK